MLGTGLTTKLEIFFFTFISYSSIHSLRTTYSYSKQSIAYELNTDKSTLGLIDTCMLLSLGAGFLYHALSPTSKPTRNLSIALLICAITYLCIPSIDNFYLLAVIMSINGFAQSFTWPNLLVLVNSKWHKSRDSTELGFWTTNANVGNIIGFAICEIVHSLNYNWKIQMYIAALLCLTTYLFVYFRLNEPNLMKASTSPKPELSLLSVLKEPSVLFVAGNLSFIKSIIYGIMLWLPMYFQNIGLTDYSTYIPIAYDISCVLGSSLLGFLFQKFTIKGMLLAPLMIILIVCFSILKYCEVSVIGYFCIISVIGPCLGGSFNTIVGLSTIQLTKNIPQEHQLSSLGVYSAVTMALANFVTALTQLLIGVVAGKDEQMIFGIFMVYSVIAFLGFAYQILKEVQENQEKEKKQ